VDTFLAGENWLASVQSPDLLLLDEQNFNDISKKGNHHFSNQSLLRKTCQDAKAATIEYLQKTPKNQNESLAFIEKLIFGLIDVPSEYPPNYFL